MEGTDSVAVNGKTSKQHVTTDELCLSHYEDKLLNYRLICEKNSLRTTLENDGCKENISLRTSSNDNDQKNKQTINSNTSLSEFIVARAGLMQSIQYSYIKSNEDLAAETKSDKRESKQPRNAHTNLETIRCLLEKTRMQLDTDACCPEFMTATNKMVHDIQRSVYDQEKQLKQRFQSVNVDADDFFDEYPHCMRSGWDQVSSSSDEESDDDDVDDKDGNIAPSRKKKLAGVAAVAIQHTVQQETSELSKQEVPIKAGIRGNPYAKKSNSDIIDLVKTDGSEQSQQKTVPQQSRQQDQFAAIAQQQKQQRTTQNLPQHQSHLTAPPIGLFISNNYPATWEESINSQSVAATAAAWEDHCSRNPFQTAREYAWAASDSHHHLQQPHQSYVNQMNQSQPPPQQHIDSQPQPQQTSNHMLQQTTTLPVYNNPYSQRKQQQESIPPQPVIRDSLKRKFQVPKVGAPKSNNSGEKNTSDGNCKDKQNNGSAGVARSRPTSSSGAKASNDDDDNDLPEELKRYGKDLVEKIENEIMENGDKISFDDIAGLVQQKQTVQEVVCWPMKRPDLFTGLRSAPNGLLLYGPPGTGKTLIGKAIAHESGATFFSISSSSLTSKWIGEGEKLVRTLFAVAAYRAPAVVFIDEIDSLLTQRKTDENEASRRIKTEFLCQLDGTGTSSQGRVLLIGATNRPQELDDAARRRFTKRLYIPLPEESDREILLRVLLEKNKHQLTDNDIKKLAKDTEGFSGADLKALSTEAAMGPIRQLGSRALEVDVSDVPPISVKHFRQALRSVRPSVAASDLNQYLEWDKIYGSNRAEDDDDVSDT